MENISIDKTEQLRRAGYMDAGISSGNISALDPCLEATLGRLLKTSGTGNDGYKSKVDDKKEEISGLLQKIESKRQLIEKLNRESREAQGNPEVAKARSGYNPFNFIVGSVILVFLTIYLIVFYSSAISSAFVKNIGSDLESLQGNDLSIVFQSVFDPSAMANAFDMGLYAVVMILFGSFIFVGMGFLLHIFFSDERYSGGRKYSVFALLFCVFIADAIIAYKITQAIHEAKLMTGITEDAWKISMIWGDVNFYLVLIAGFASYVIWGVLLGYVVGQFNAMHSVSFLLRKYMTEIESADSEIERMGAELETAKRSLYQYEGLVRSNISDASAVVGDLSAYYNGWLGFLSGLYRGEPGNLVFAEAKVAFGEFIQKRNLA
jgi:hypothetical protein